jgi:hypothetical protein
LSIGSPLKVSTDLLSFGRPVLSSYLSNLLVYYTMTVSRLIAVSHCI